MADSAQQVAEGISPMVVSDVVYRKRAKAGMSYPISLEGDFSTQGVVTRLDNVPDKIPQYIDPAQLRRENNEDITAHGAARAFFISAGYFRPAIFTEGGGSP
ncbi:MAG: hypothetical protein FWD98_01630 [Defluviitaleaceae bacterium]|nr:hypothetical protein [Defluviitaleaceae bacterium]